MESLVKLYLEWEIQVIVLVSFTLQVWLFFTGSLGRRSVNMFLRFLIWIAYLGADFVAVYALGYLARHQDVVPAAARRTQSLAFFWAPFLLNHLGGQDTITAFAMEDNNLWLRHSLNLVVQVGLAVYVFWKSVGGHSVELLVSGVFVFVAGVTKYGERAWALMLGSSESLRNSPDFVSEYSMFLRLPARASCYCGTVTYAIQGMIYVVNIFAERVRYVVPYDDFEEPPALPRGLYDTERDLKAVDIQLAMLRDDLYTKARVLRTRIGIILRCISLMSWTAALALFHTSDKRRHSNSSSKADVAITYSLFLGGFLLDVAAMFVFIMSPYTWAWLKLRGWHRLSSLSWFLFSSPIGWPKKKTQWSNSMGQYELKCWFYGRESPRSCSQRVMSVVKRLVNFVRGRNGNVTWMSKLLDTEYVEADEKMMGFVCEGINRLCHELTSGDPRGWPNLGPFLHRIRDYFTEDFGAAVAMMHVFTKEQLFLFKKEKEQLDEAADDDANGDTVQVCRKLSNYMMHLLVSCPSMLPINSNSEATMERFKFKELSEDELCGIQPSKETLEEMADVWAGLLIYAAGKSRGEMHVPKLATGGELITVVWLLMATAGLGDSEKNRILLANSADGATAFGEAYVFYFHPSSAAGNSITPSVLEKKVVSDNDTISEA